MIHRIKVLEDERAFSLGWKGRLVIFTAALVALSVFFYRETLRDLFLSVLYREGSSHGLFVPFIIGYFFWLKRTRIRRLELCFSLLPGAVMVVGGFFIYYFSGGNTDVTFPSVSFMLVVYGLVMALFGTQVFKEVSFPLLFLLTMIPIPKTIYHEIAVWMREVTTSGSVWMTQLMQISIFREAYNIHLPNANLFIAMGCSGIRYLLSYFVFSLAYAFLAKKDIKARIMVVAASFPIAFVAGVLRLTSIYLAVYFIGPFMAGRRAHILVSWVVFLLVLVLAIATDQVLSGIRGRRKA